MVPPMKIDGFVRVVVCGLLCLAGSRLAWPDDGAASIGAGGLVMKREARIVMAREVLRIGLNSVAVDYDFRNDGDEDVTTEVAFPIPPYEADWAEKDASRQGFDDFRLWVNEQPQKYATEVKATLKGRDVTAILRGLRMDIASFGHLEKDQPVMKDLERLTPTQRQSLRKAGLIDSADPGAQAEWTVEKKYYWPQRFPAHSTTHIRQTYSPYVGFQATDSTTVADLPNLLRMESPAYPLDVLQSMCPNQPLLDRLYAREKDLGFGLQWVDFILTSANTWKRPIEDFTLVVERPRDSKLGQLLVSFCSPGKVEKMDADHFNLQMKNFVTQKELRIGFIQMWTAQGAGQ